MSRVYDDGFGLVRVSVSDIDRQWKTHLPNYSYENTPLLDVPVQHRGRLYDNKTSERVGIGRALLSIGLTSVAMWPQSPPKPDMLIETPQFGKFVADFTMGHDEQNRQFQEEMQKFVRGLQSQIDALRERIPWLNERGIQMGFLDVPGQREAASIASRLVDFITATEGREGRYPIEDRRVARFIPYVLITLGGHDGEVTGGVLVIERGVFPNHAAVAIERIEKKRAKKYDTEGLPLWIIVGVGTPLIEGDYIAKLYRTDLCLAHIERALIVSDEQVVMFERSEGLRCPV
jgi:hypothetical protein